MNDAVTAHMPPVLTIGPARLTAGLDLFQRLNLATHQAVHGSVRPLLLDDLLDLADRIQLHGRGGAGFPFARKVRAVRDAARRRNSATSIVVNATEGEPGSWKDKVLLTRTPHLILDGAALAAHALAADSIVIGVADDGVGAQSMLAALAERRLPAPARVVTVPHRFISGEGGALVRGINGDIPIPPGRRGRVSDSGVNGLPTLLSNAETLAQLAIAARIGPEGYAEVGIPDEPGTVLLTIGGSALRPSVVETPTGVPLRTILDECDAAPGPAVLTGGFHGAWVTGSAVDGINISRRGFESAGGTLGAGIMLTLGDGTCPLGEATSIARYLAGQSAGQCGPCRMGLPDLARSMSALTGSSGGTQAVDDIRASAQAVRGRGACSHPDGSARFALSALDAFVDDIAAHLLHDGCGRPTLGVMPLGPDEVGSARLAIDWTRCDGHGLCAHLAPELITLDRNGFPAFADASVPAWLEGEARKAVSMCPALALRLTHPAKPPARAKRR